MTSACALRAARDRRLDVSGKIPPARGPSAAGAWLCDALRTDLGGAESAAAGRNDGVATLSRRRSKEPFKYFIREIWLSG